MKSLYKKKFRDDDRYVNNPGETEKTLYVLDRDHLIEAGKEDTVALINSYADSVDLVKIIDRVSQGEFELLSKRTGMYIDTTKFPTYVCDIANQVRDNKSAFDSLPDDIRKELGTFNQFANWTEDDFAKFVENHKVIPDVVSNESEVVE